MLKDRVGGTDMARWITSISMVMAAAISMSAPKALAADPWGLVRSPSPGPSLAIGLPSDGCLAGAKTLAVRGPGWREVYPARHRFYGHPALIAFVHRLAAEVRARHMGTLLLGDLAQPRGGPMSSGHRSHQLGLDVDVYLHLAHHPLTVTGRARLETISMVDGGAINSQAWGRPQMRLLRLAARDPAVGRIFVNPAIKRHLCRTLTGKRAWLRKIRPWWGHRRHFHVRLICPHGDYACVSQAPIPPGDGCDATLAWWFTPAAKVPTPPVHAGPPVLPAACGRVLADRAVPAGRRSLSRR